MTGAQRGRSLGQWAIDRTKLPGEASEEDVRRLKAEGLDDRAILDATLTIGYFNFVNRLVLMLGVHLEDDFAATPSRSRWIRLNVDFWNRIALYISRCACIALGLSDCTWCTVATPPRAPAIRW